MFTNLSAGSKIIIGVSFALIVALGVLVLTRPDSSGGAVLAERDSGQALIGGPFTLTDHTGAAFTEQSLAGQASLIYFGYTYCPDICPLSLQKMSAALDQLSADQAALFRPILVSVDPERDTVETMAAYVSSDAFPDNLIGLTGTPEQVETAKAAYRVRSAIVDADESAADYLVDHTSLIFLMDAQADFVTVFSHVDSPSIIAQGLRDYIASQ